MLLFMIFSNRVALAHYSELLPNFSRSALLASQEEPVKCIARIKEASDDRTRRVGHRGVSALEWASARAWSIERCDDTVTSAHKTMIHVVRVDVIPRNRPRYTDALANRSLEGTGTRTWNIERGDATVTSPHKTVIHIARVNEPASDGPRGVDA